MPTEFQKIMDQILERLSNDYTFIDDILVITTSTETEH